MLLKQRQQPTFSYLLDNYSLALYTVVFNLVHDETIAADTKGRLFTWVMNIARNAVIGNVSS